MRIWFKDYRLEDLIARSSGNMLQHTQIEFIELGHNFIRATMPVDHRTTTPVGLFHGGASCVLAESIGTCASYLCIDPEIHSAVGIEINANHLRSVTSGYVVGVVTPVHLGRSLHVWDIRIHDHTRPDQLVCISRLTTKILDKRNA